MALSFEDSLKATMIASTMSLRSASNYNVAAVAEEEPWEDVLGYAKSYPDRDNYHDDKYSSVDINKVVSISEGQINLTQEQNSQFIPFKFDRYWDNVDISKMKFLINFVNVDGQMGYDIPINMQRNSTHIKFDWLVSGAATALKGILTFEIYASGEIQVGDSMRTYEWRTQPCKGINILESLAGNGEIEPIDGLAGYITEITNQVYAAQAAVDEAKAIAQSMKETAESIEEVVETNVMQTISDGYYDRTAVDNHLATKANVSDLDNYYLKTLGEQLESEIETINNTLQNKVNTDTFEEELAKKATVDDLANLSETVNGTINGQIAEINGVLATKADVSAVESLENTITAELNEKASADDLRNLSDAVNNTITNQLEEINKTIATKADSSVVTSLSDNLTRNYYTSEKVDELIENIDVTSQLEELEEKIADEYYDIIASDNRYYLKTDAETLTGRVDDVETALETKVDSDTFTEEINKKANTDDLLYFEGEVNQEISDINEALNTVNETLVTKADFTVVTELSGTVDDISTNIKNNYYQKTEIYSKEETDSAIKTAVDAVDVTEELGELEQKIADEYYKKTETYTKEEVDTLVENVDVTEDLNNLKTEIEQNVSARITSINESLTTKADSSAVTELSNKIDQIDSRVTTNTTNITNANALIANINSTLDGMDKSPNAYYETTYNEPYSINGVEYTGENALVLYEIYNKDTESETRTAISAHVITGGSGGGSANTIKIERITDSPLVVTSDDKVIIEYNFTGTDSSGEDIGQGNATWKVGNRLVKTESVYTGENFVDLTEYMSVASDQKVTLIITDDVGTMQQKIWYVSVVDVKLESAFDDTRTYNAGSAVNFTFTPYGSVDKTVHFLMDGKEIATKTSAKSAAGLSDSYTIPAQNHGTHLFEVYMTATINDNDIESNHIVKDIIWYDSDSKIPVIGCVSQEFTAKQYETTNINYTVYDPSTETPTVTLKATYVNEDGETVETYNSTLTLSANTDVWAFKTDVIGEHTLTITCGETVKILTATIVDIGIQVSPTTAGLEFDFNPLGRSNNDTNRIWSDSNTGVAMTVSDNFDWTNGGYQMDDAGDQYFCVKAGTTATINYNLFADDAKANGKEFKVIFKTTNVKNRNTSFISCMDYGIGLDMKVQDANIYSSNGSLYSPYCEEDIIEFEFNINKSSDIPMVLTYEDGVGNRPMIYTSDASFWQTNPTPITIGSPFCDVHVYRMKAYSTSLSDKDILNNFIADARSAEEMISRYTRNQIYKDGALNPEHLAEVCPDLRIILIDAPWFTNDKDNKVTDTNITMIYKNGDPILDNWTCTGATHRGQGTSSNEYGYSSRNVDLVMDTDTSLFTLGDGKTTSNTITLTRDSVPTDYLNIKVNVASSENQNNAQMARNYSLFNPFIRFARWKDSKVKDCMEFYNCAVFIRERNEDISTHREFQDTNWHFYSIGNVGDSKKTDDTRVNDKNDPKECIVEITDYNVPLAEFPTGNDRICPESEWKTGNTAYDFLYSEYEYEDGEFKSFGAGSYEFRYEMKKITEEQRQENIYTWREMYKFIVTSSDEDFYAKLKEWFVIDSVLYYYLFTERYTMVDNRAKNSFWHYGKVYISESEAETLGADAGGYIIDNTQAAIRNGYRYDLSQGYDFDTSLGIDNTGKLVLTYGKEDTDFYVDGDSTSGYIYRAAESTFFCRIRDLFASELQAMFVDRENQNAWSASRLIKQWDDAQAQFPEELWRLDIQRKYLRTYQGISIDNSLPGEANPRFLTEMMNGRKKYQRRMFERNQELYMATKYFGKTATQDQIMMRFNNPVGAAISPDFTLYITPYSDMYIGVSFGNVTPTNFRAKAGVEYTVPCSIESGTADITLIYGASFIQAIGDLSRCYVGDNDFSKASRLQSLVIGSDADGYSNAFMTKISLGNNKLLEYLDIRNVTGLNSVVDLSNCNNLIELYAENSGATGVIFANGGKVKKAHLPAVTSLTAKNLNYLEEFIIANYDKLQSLTVENTPFLNTHDMISVSPTLRVLRLIGIDWKIANTDILDRIMTFRGKDNNDNEIPQSVLSGKVYVPTIQELVLAEYNAAWKDLTISCGTMINQYAATFKNYDGEILNVQYVTKGEKPVDPYATGLIDKPSRESTASHDYEYAGWDQSFTSMFANQTFTATYTETLRNYQIQFASMGTNIGDPITAPYGTYVYYEGETPTYTGMESAYTYTLFSGWDDSGYVDGGEGFVDGVKTINAVYDTMTYTAGYYDGKDLSEMSMVELYALTTSLTKGESPDVNLDSVVDLADSMTFTMGADFEYEGVESQVLIADTMEFDGSNYHDTGISLFDEDKDFVVAIDYEFGDGNSSRSTLIQCYQNDGSDGFEITYSTNPTITWGNESSYQCATGTNREMLVLRHVKGETGLHVYVSNLSNMQSGYVELTRGGGIETITDATLIFGAKKTLNGDYYMYQDKAIGKIHWAKVWMTDLGDSGCKELAMYIREKVTVQLCDTFDKSLSDVSSTLNTMSFLGANTIYVNRRMMASTGNSGGFAASELREWLENRFYPAMPNQLRQLIKKVKVAGSIGGTSSEVTTCDCHIYIPSVIELSGGDKAFTDNNPYKGEDDEPIGYITNAETRLRTNTSGVATRYWTRSPSATHSDYFYFVNAEGSLDRFVTTTTALGVVIEFSI